jgi:hypothetical protein
LTDHASEDDLRRFFRARIVPAAEALRARGTEFFALEPDRARSSYWNTRPREEGYIFEIGDDLAGEFHAMWRDHPDLQTLAAELAAISRTLDHRVDESGDVSPFIYAMF